MTKSLPLMITAEALLQRVACETQVAVFRREWPDGCEVTEATLLRAAQLGLDLNWFARRFLPGSLWEEYERQLAPLRGAEYLRQRVLLIWRLLVQWETAGV